MTGKEIIELTYKGIDLVEQIGNEFVERIKELYVIAKEKGYGTTFGWLGGEVECPDIDDFETKEEYSEAEKEYDKFCSSAIEFVWANDHNLIPYDGYSFEINENGRVTFKSVINVESEGDYEFYDDEYLIFYVGLADNWKSCGQIVRRIESELGI